MILDLTQILVFKTNISTESEKLKVRELLDSNPHIAEWSVDTEDVDCVLRVVSPLLGAGEIIELIQNGGFECRELE